VITRWAIALAVVVAGPGSSEALSQEVTARARVDSTSYLVGDWIKIGFEVTHPSGTAVEPAVGDTIGGFSVLQRPKLESPNPTTTSGSLVIAKYDSGLAILPPLEFFYKLAGDTVTRVVATNPLLLTIRTIPVDTSRAIKDIKPPLSIPITLAEVALVAGVVLLVAMVVYFLYRYLKKRREKAAGVVYVPPKRPAHVVALEELAALKEKRLWQQGFIKAYYSEVADILRRYFENRFGFMALEQTTDEIVGELRTRSQDAALLEKVERALRRADLVKFAKFQPGIPEHEEMFSLALEIVEATRAREMQQAHQTAKEEMARVES
jgi:hypothetical protein